MQQHRLQCHSTCYNSNFELLLHHPMRIWRAFPLLAFLSFALVWSPLFPPFHSLSPTFPPADLFSPFPSLGWSPTSQFSLYLPISPLSPPPPDQEDSWLQQSAVRPLQILQLYPYITDPSPADDNTPSGNNTDYKSDTDDNTDQHTPTFPITPSQTPLLLSYWW